MFDAIKCEAALNSDGSLHRVKRFTVKCTIRKIIRNNPVRAIRNFLANEVKLISIKR